MDRKKALIEELTAHLTSVRDISDGATKADREYTDAERTQLTEGMGKIKEIKASLDQMKADEAVKAAIADLGDGIGINEKAGEKRTASGLIIPDARKTIGQHYVEGAEYKALLNSVPSGSFSAKHRVQTNPTGFKSLLPPKYGEKALVTGLSDTSAGAFVDSDRLGLQVGLDPFQRPLRLRNLVTNGTTDTDQIDYVRVTGFTNNAAPVAEATSAAAATTVTSGVLQPAANGGYKPESALATARVTAPIRTIAHWIPVTKRALSDAAQMTTLIDNFLEYGLEEEVEDQMIAGDGTSENFEGIANVSGVQTQAFSTNLLTTLRKGKTKVRIGARSVPNGYVMNPADVETLDLLADNENRYYWGGPAAQGMPGSSLWGLPVIESEAVPAGTAYVADWKKAILWDRQQSTITTTDSHLDYFVRNLVAILAELRAGFGVLQPSAFVKIALS